MQKERLSLAPTLEEDAQLYRDVLTAHACHAIVEQLAKTGKVTLPSNGVPFMSTEGLLDVTGNSFNCAFRLTRRLPCRHIFAQRLADGQPAFDASLVDAQWVARYSQAVAEAIATNDEGLDVVRQVRRNNMQCDMVTPCCVRKYNSLMAGVDRMDQLRSYYSVGRAGRRWWKYIFWGLWNIGNINTYILWKMNHPLHANSRVSSLKTWKMRLIHNMVDDYVSRSLQRCEPAVDNLSVERVFADNIAPGHPLVWFPGRRRTCKQCARQKTKTTTGRYIESCFGCSASKVYLCRTGCFVAFHRDMDCRDVKLLIALRTWATLY